MNLIIKNRDNDVKLTFSFSGVENLTSFTEIRFFLGDEEYYSVNNPSNVSVSSSTELTIALGTTIIIGEYLYSDCCRLFCSVS